MKKVLFTATVDSHILAFHIPYLKLFKDKGYEVHVATNGNEKIPYCDKKIVIPFERNPFKLNNLKAIKKLRKVIESEHYDVIHTHTPMGSVVTRLAAKKARKKGTRVIYTAHGFHFFTGAPFINWCLFYPVEKYLSKYTDTLITINIEDYERAKRKFKKCKDIQYVPGVGIDEKKFDFKMSEKEKMELRKSLGLKKDDFVLIYPAEISKRKNQLWLIATVEPLLKTHENIHLLLPGKDSLNGKCQQLIKKYSLKNQVHMLGFREDIPQLLKISNLAISSSKQEGLPVNIMEAMYMGLPVVATDCRGNRDLVKNEKNGYIVGHDSELFKDKILELYTNPSIYKKFSKNNFIYIKDYKLDFILEKVTKIYSKKRKVLHLLASNKYSGAENVVCTIIETMSPFFDMAYCSPKGPIKEALQEKKITYYELKKLNYNRLKHILGEFCPDIIHAHDIKASLLASRFGKKYYVISHLHKNDSSMSKISLKSILYRLVSKNFACVVGVSHSVLDEYIFQKNISNKFKILYNYVDANKIKKMANEFSAEQNYDFFYLGRLSPEKNPVEFIRIIEYLSKRKKVTAVMIGDGPLFDTCKRLICEKQLKIDMLGFQSNPFPYIKNASIGIMPSQYEGFGLTAIECNILGKPVFNSGVGGLKEIYANVPFYICKSVEEYVQKIQKYQSHPSKVLLISKYSDINYFQKELLSIYEYAIGKERV